MKYIIYLALFFCLPVLGQDTETISWEEAKINDRIAMTLSKAEFDKRYKKADSITAPKPGEICGREEEANVKMVHYKGMRFELDNGIMNFRSIDFSKNRNNYLSIDSDWFDRTTTLKSFTKSFPASASFVEDVDGVNGELYQMIVILPPKVDDDYEWHFYFQDEKLRFIECYFSCD